MTSPSDAARAACPSAEGLFEPVIDRRRCEGKGGCVAVCPQAVFVVRRFERAELPGLGVIGTLRRWTSGGMQADPVGAEHCRACALCVQACPEDAITLRRRSPS